METVLEPTDADASSEPEERFGKSVDTSVIEPEPEPTEVETEVEEVAGEPESEAESSPAEVEDLDKKADPQPGDIEYTKAVKERIDDLTTSFREEQRKGTAKDLQIEELQAQIDAIPVQEEPLKTLEDFEYDNEKWQSYMATEIPKRAKEAAREELKGFQAKADTESRQDAFRRREKEFAADHSDYESLVYGKVDGQRRWVASDNMVREIMLSDMGQELTYHLASNPDIAAKLYNLDAHETTRRIALLESKLVSEKAKAKPKAVSDAPPPVPKIKAGDPGLDKGYHEGMSDKAFDKQRRKEIDNR